MVGLRLAVVGSIKDELLQAEELALWLLGYTRGHYPGLFARRATSFRKKAASWEPALAALRMRVAVS